MDPYGTIHPNWPPKVQRRFWVWVDRHDADDEPDWQYKLRVVDRKYQDSEGYPVDAIAGGASWEAAYAQAGAYIDHALNSDRCVF